VRGQNVGVSIIMKFSGRCDGAGNISSIIFNRSTFISRHIMKILIARHLLESICLMLYAIYAHERYVSRGEYANFWTNHMIRFKTSSLEKLVFRYLDMKSSRLM